jgi:hypothetical protein
MNREQWLLRGMHELNRRVFRPAKYKLSPRIQVSCGFPSQGAFGMAKRRIGECWYPQTAQDQRHNLFVSPTLDDPVQVLDVLTHEMVHTVAGKTAKHGKKFAHIAKHVGLTGKMTATVAGDALRLQLERIVQSLGPYPHKAISSSRLLRPAPKIKYVTGECVCGYIARVPEEWVESAGLPACPACDTPLI